MLHTFSKIATAARVQEREPLRSVGRNTEELRLPDAPRWGYCSLNCVPGGWRFQHLQNTTLDRVFGSSSASIGFRFAGILHQHDVDIFGILVAFPADESRAGFPPGILSTLWTGELRLAGLLCFGGGTFLCFLRRRFPMKPKPSGRSVWRNPRRTRLRQR